MLTPESDDVSRSKKKVELDPRLFAHIHLDHRLIGSHLQGTTFSVTANYLLEALTYFSSEAGAESIASTLDPAEVKQTLDAVIPQFEALVDIEEKVREATSKLAGEMSVHKLTEKEYQDHIAQYKRFYTTPCIIVDENKIPSKLIIKKDNKIVMIDPIGDYPQDLLTCENVWSGHPVAEWLEEKEHKLEFRSPTVDTLLNLQKKYIKSVAESIVEKLNIQNKLLIPGGWASEPGHAMLYQLIKNPDGSYNFIVYNTGDGSQYHVQQSSVKDKFIPLIAYKIPNSVTSAELEAFITDLLTPQIAPVLREMRPERYGGICEQNWEVKRIYDAKRVYKEVIEEKLTLLHAKPLDNPVQAVNPEENKSVTTQGQLSGTCAMRAFEPFLEVNMRGKTSSIFLYESDLRSIFTDYETEKQKADLAKPNNLYSPMVRRQLLQAIRRIAIKTGKLSTRNTQDGHPILSEEKASHILKNLSVLQTELKQLSQKTSETDTQKIEFSEKALNFSSVPHVSSTYRALLFIGFQDSEKFDVNDVNNEGMQNSILADKEYGRYRSEPRIYLIQKEGYFEIYYKKVEQGQGAIAKLIIENNPENEELFSLLMHCKTGDVAEKSPDEKKTRELIFNLIRKNGGLTEWELTKVFNESDYASNIAEKTPEKPLPQQADKDYIDNPHAFLKACYEAVSENDRMGYGEAIKYQVENLFLSFPVDNKEALDRYWRNLSQEQSRETLMHLQCILRIYAKNCGRLNPYPNAIQTMTGYTGLLMGNYIINRFFDNKPIFEALTAQVVPTKFPRSVEANTLDPKFDQRMLDIKALSDSIRIGKTVSCKTEEHYDMAFLKYMSSFDPGIELLKEKYTGSADELRQNFHEALKGKTQSIKLSEETKKAYDIFLQFSVMQEECSKLTEARYNYFNSVNTEANQDESYARIAKIEYKEQQYWNEADKFFEFEGEKFKKNGDFSYNVEDVQKYVTSHPLAFHDFLKMQRIPLIRVLNTGADGDSNAILLGELLLLRASREHMPRTVPFLGQTTACSAAVTKDFFESNFDLLNKHDYQVVCLMNLFSPKVLEIQISNNIHFVEDLKRFLEEGLRYHSREAQELSGGGVFVFKLQYFLLKYLQCQPDRHNPEIKAVLQWLEEQNKLLLEKMQLQALNGNEKTARELLVIYFLKLSLLEESPDKGETIKQNLPMLLSCLLKSRMAEKDDLILDLELMRAAQKIKPDIQEQFNLLSFDEKRSLMKTILQEILVPNILSDINKLDDCEMFFEYPIVKINAEIGIDLSLGKVESTQGRMEAIPSEIYNDAQFRSLFGQSSLPAMRQDLAGRSIYHFNFKGQEYKIIKEVGNALAIQTKPPGEKNWFELVNKNHIYTVSARYLDVDCFWWRETNVIFPNLANDYCTSVDNGYVIKIERDSEAQTQACFELHRDGSKTGYQYLWDNKKENSALYDVFRNFESSENIEIWGELGQDPPLKVKLPRYNLAWEVTIEDDALIYRWSKNKDFKLVVDHPQIIDGFPHVLYMRNEKTGEEIAIIPNQEFYVEDLEKHDGEYYALTYDTGNVIPKTIGDKKKYNQSWQTTETQKYSQYSVVNNELFAKTSEEYLQLAYIYLAKHDPEHAMWALRQCRKLGAIQGTKDEVKLLMKIMKDTPNKDYNEGHYSQAFVEDPETIAVRLYASYLLAEQKQSSLNQMVSTASLKKKAAKTNNDQYREETDTKVLTFYQEEFKDLLNQNYQSYRKVLGNIPEDMQLDYNQRFFLLRDIKNPTEAMQHELVMLEYIAAREQRKQYYKKLKQLKTEKPSESDIKILADLDDKIKTLDNLLKEMDDKRKRELATVYSSEMLSALEGAEFIDMRQFLHSTPSVVKSDFKQQVDALSKMPTEEQEAIPFEELPFLERQQKKRELEMKVGAQKNILLKEKIGFYEQYFTEDVLVNLRKQFSEIATDPVIQKEEEGAILRFANEAISGADSKIKTTSELMGNIKSELQFGDLIWLYLQGDQSQYIQKTKITDPKKIEALHLKIHEYLLRYTEDQHNKRVLRYLSDLEVCEGYECQDAIIKLGNELSAVREYDPKDDPETLIFEYLEDLLVRDDQATVINGLLEKEGEGYKNKIVQLIMGFGKSKILLPIMALKRANGTNLSFIEIPSNLFGPGFADLSEKTKRLFGKSGFPFIFNRDSNCSSENLKALYHGLLDAMRNREYIATTPESMLSLELKYLELTDLNEVSLEEQAQIIALENILTLIEERGDVLIEECDTALEKKKELNYTIGSAEPVKKYQLADTLKIFRLLDKEIIRREKEIIKDDDWDKIIEDLAIAIMNDKKGPIKFVDFKSPEEDDQKQQFLNYILNKTDVIPDFIVKNYDWNQRNHIGLVKGELALLKSCLRKKPSEFYGFPLSDDYPGNKTLAIPYVGNNEPNERAKFSTYETIIYTTLLHKQKGILPDDLIIRFISDFRAAAKQELLDNVHLKGLTFETTKAARKFEKLTGISLGSIKLNLDSEYHLNLNEAAYLSELQHTISKNEKSFDYVLQNYILSDIKVNKRILKANRINHVSQFRSASGVSGTPWNARSYNQRFEFDEKDSIGIDGVTIDHLVNKNPVVFSLNSKDPSQIIQKHVMNNENFGRIHAFLDVGSIFEGKSNLEIAQLFADQLRTRQDNEIKHVLYFNNENKLCALPVSPGPIIVIDSTDPRVITELTGSKPQYRFTYYDQRHTTGIDIEQTPDAIGVVSLDPQTKARDCWQGVMRLRKLSGNQTVEFILPEVAAAKNVNDVIDLVEKNQINQLAEIHLLAALANMDNVIRAHFKKKLFDCKDMTLKLALRKQYAEIFDTETKEEGFDKFGAVESETDLDTILSRHQSGCLEKLKALDPLLEIDILQTLSASLSKIAFDAKKNCLPIYKYARVPDAGLELEVEKEKEQEKEQEKELEQESETWDPRIRAAPYKPWKNLSENFHNQDQIKIDPLNDMVPFNLGFSENIFVSENYQKTYIGQTNYIDKFIKPVTLFLVVKEPDGKLKILLITQDEYKEFLDFLSVQQNKNQLKDNNVQMWVVSPHNTVLCGTSNTVDEEGTDYQNLLSQIQYFNADLNMLSRSEQFDWLLGESPYEKMEFLENEILQNYPEKKKHLHYFKNVITQKLSEQLAKINQSVDISTAFESIRIPDEESGLQIIDNYLSAVESIENENFKKLVVNFSTIKEDGKNLSLLGLGLAIKYDRKSIVQRLVDSGLVASSYNVACNPMMLAIAYKRSEILKLLVAESNLYPRGPHKEAWFKLFGAMLKHKQLETREVFLSHMKAQCPPVIINQLIEIEIQKLVVTTGVSDATILRTLQALGALTDRPFLDIYKKYLSKVFDILPPDEVLRVLSILYDASPNVEVKDYLTQLAREIKRPDVFEKVMTDLRFAIKTDDPEYWAQILGLHLNPGTYLHVLEYANLPNDRSLLIEMGKIPAVRLDNGKKPSEIIVSKKGKVTSISVGQYALSDSLEKPELLVPFVDNYLYGDKKMFLEGDDPLLQGLISARSIQLQVKPATLEFLLPSVMRMDTATKEQLSQKLAAAEIFRTLEERLFPSKNRSTYSSYREPPFNIKSLPTVYLDMAIMFLGAGGSEFLINIHPFLFMGEGLVANDVVIFYKNLISKLDFTDISHQKLGRFYLKGLLNLRPEENAMCDIIQLMLDKGFSFEGYDDNDMAELLKSLVDHRTSSLVKNRVVTVIKKNERLGGMVLQNLLQEKHWRYDSNNSQLVIQLLAEISVDELRKLSLGPEVFIEVFNILKSRENIDFNFVQKIIILGNISVDKTKDLFPKALAQNELEYCRHYLQRLGDEHGSQFSGDTKAYLETVSQHGAAAIEKTVNILKGLDLFGRYGYIDKEYYVYFCQFALDKGFDDLFVEWFKRLSAEYLEALLLRAIEHNNKKIAKYLLDKLFENSWQVNWTVFNAALKAVLNEPINWEMFDILVSKGYVNEEAIQLLITLVDRGLVGERFVTVLDLVNKNISTVRDQKLKERIENLSLSLDKKKLDQYVEDKNWAGVVPLLGYGKKVLDSLSQAEIKHIFSIATMDDDSSPGKNTVIQTLLRKCGAWGYGEKDTLSSFRRDVARVDTLGVLYELGAINTKEALLEVCNFVARNLHYKLDVEYFKKLIEIHDGLQYEGKGTLIELINSVYSNFTNSVIKNILGFQAAKVLSQAGMTYNKEALVLLCKDACVSGDLELLKYLVELHHNAHYEGKGSFADIINGVEIWRQNALQYVESSAFKVKEPERTNFIETLKELLKPEPEKKLTFQYDSLNKDAEKKDEPSPDDSKPTPTGS